MMPKGLTTEQEEAQERRNVAAAKWIIDYDGKALPVTNLFDSDSHESFDPVLAVSCVAFDAESKDGKGHWYVFGNLEPGDIWRKTT